MAVLDNELEYTKNPLYKFHEPSDYRFFYFTLAFCSAFAIFLLVLNVYLCCFSKYRKYWLDSRTGNRWILPIWIKTPANQTPLDLKELEYVIVKDRSVYDVQIAEQKAYDSHTAEHSEYDSPHREEFIELRKKESDI